MIRLISLSLLAASAAGAPGLSDEERAGKRIFLEGESPSGGTITARIGPPGGPTLPGSALACGGCHGEDGLGRPEGGAVPSDITWSHLTKPYGHVHEDGRRHPAFDVRSLGAAIRGGVDPAGGSLAATMPRYALSDRDLASLLAYLRRLETDRDPGVTSQALRLGTVLPTGGPLAPIGAAMRAAMEGALEAVNARGGVHGRRVELEVAGYDSEAATGLESARAVLPRVLALVGGFYPAAEKAIGELVEREGVPAIAPLTFRAPPAGAPERYVFFAAPGVREQVHALLKYAATELRLADPLVAVLHGRDPNEAEAAAAAAAAVRERGWRAAPVVALDRKRAAELASRRAGEGRELVVFIAEDAELAAFLAAADAARWSPYLLVPGTVAARAAAGAPRSFQGRILVAYPALRAAEKPSVAGELARAGARAGVGEAHRPAQVAGWTAVAVTIEALRHVGRSVSRAKLLSGLEGLRGFDPGLGPPLSFGPDRRIGALGAFVVAADVERQTFRAGGWVELP